MRFQLSLFVLALSACQSTEFSLPPRPSAGSFAEPPPEITAVVPEQAFDGEIVEVRGDHFVDPANEAGAADAGVIAGVEVRFSGVSARIASVEHTESGWTLRAEVPRGLLSKSQGAGDLDLVLSNHGGDAHHTFRVLGPGHITEVPSATTVIPTDAGPCAEGTVGLVCAEPFLARLVVYDAKTGETKALLNLRIADPDHAGATLEGVPIDLAFSPDGARAAVAFRIAGYLHPDLSGIAIFESCGSAFVQTRVVVLDPKHGFVRHLEWPASGGHILVASGGTTGAGSGTGIARFKDGTGQPACTAAPTGALSATGYEEDAFWGFAGFQTSQVFVAPAEDGRVALGERNVTVYDASGAPVSNGFLVLPGTTSLTALQWVKDAGGGARLAALDETGSLHLWAPGEAKATTLALPEGGSALASDGKGRVFAAVPAGVEVFDLAQGRATGFIRTSAQVKHLAASRSAPGLLFGSATLPRPDHRHDGSRRGTAGAEVLVLERDAQAELASFVPRLGFTASAFLRERGFSSTTSGESDRFDLFSAIASPAADVALVINWTSTVDNVFVADSGRQGTDGPIVGVAAVGSQLAVARRDGVRVLSWDFSGGHEVQQVRPGGEIRGIAAFGDGFAVLLPDRIVRIGGKACATDSAACTTKLPGDFMVRRPSPVSLFAAADLSGTLYVPLEDPLVVGEVTVDGTVRRRIKPAGPTQDLAALASSLRGDLVAWAVPYADDFAQCYGVGPKDEQPRNGINANVEGTALAAAPDGTAFYSGGRDGKLFATVLRAEGAQQHALPVLGGDVRALATSPSGEFMDALVDGPQFTVVRLR